MAGKRSRQNFVCDLGYYEGMPMVADTPITPDCEPHTPRPEGYIAWSEWAEMIGRDSHAAPL